jgi:shikimate dehydrogenase
VVVEELERADDETLLSGHNTDVAGFVGALQDGGFQTSGASAVVVGAGGAARAVVFGLLQTDIAKIVVLNRTPEHAEALVSELMSAPGATAEPAIEALPLTRETLLDAAGGADLLVNATPVGMWPRVERSVWPDEAPMPAHLTVFDLVYNPLETKLQRQARASGAAAIHGLGMLVRQGALAFEMWTDEKAPISVMRRACERALKGQPRAQTDG